MSKRVLITGGTKGIGLACAKLFLEKGCQVVATSRKVTDSICSVVSMDVTDHDSVISGVQQALSMMGGIDVLVNCAGVGVGGALEDFSPDQIQLECETNLIGAARVIKEVLPLMRKQGKGHIFCVGSVAGEIPIPFQSMYSASKAGLAAMTDALRMECKPFGIAVCTVEPGDTKTGFTSARQYAEGISRNGAYQDACENALNTMIHDEMNGKDPSSVAKVIYRLSGKKCIPARITVGFGYKCLRALAWLLPKCLVEWILTLMYPKHKAEKIFKY